MPLMLDVSDEVRAEIGDDEANRLLTGENAPETYDCTSCRTSGDATVERTSTVLFIGEETAVLAFAHASCTPSQVVSVAEEQLLGAVETITRGAAMNTAAKAGPAAAVPVPEPVTAPAQGLSADPPITGGAPSKPRSAVLSVTCGLVLCDGTAYAALVVEPGGPVARPGSAEGGDEFLPLLLEQGFAPVNDVEKPLSGPSGWSVLLVAGRLHAVLQPGGTSGHSPWWQAHTPMQVSDAWRTAATRHNRVLLYAAPAGAIGHQPREDVMRQALDQASAQGLLAGASLPLADTA